MARRLALFFSLLLAFAYPLDASRITTATPTAAAVERAVITPATVTARDDPADFTPPSITPPSIPPVSVPSVSISIHTCTQTITPDKNGFVPPGTCGALYNYYPSFGAAIAMSVLFGIVTIAHIVQAAIYKKAFCWVVIMGALWETGSFVTRTISTRNQQSSGIVLVSQIFILLAPLLVNAFDYMVLARMIHFYLPERKLPYIHPTWLALCFVLLDFVSFVIQLVGGTMAAPGSSPDQISRALGIYKGGIGLQQAFIVIFLGIAVVFHVRMRRAEQSRVLMSAGWALEPGWQTLLYALYASLLFITVRIIFRFVEFSAGVGLKNPVVTTEAYLYVFDSVPMILSILCWNIAHPGMKLVGPHSEPPKIELRKKLRLKKRSKETNDPKRHEPKGNYEMV